MSLIHCVNKLANFGNRSIGVKWTKSQFSYSLFRCYLSSQNSTLMGVVDNAKQSPVAQTDSNQTSDFTSALKNFGFEEVVCLDIIAKEPQVLQLSTYELRQALLTWNKSEIGLDFLKILFQSNPQFLLLPSSLLERRLPLIKQFSKKPKSIISLLLMNPNMMTEKWDHIIAKVDYIVDVMRIEEQELIRCSALNKDLAHIKLRHTLLEKCGMFCAPNKYEHKRVKNVKSAFKNPPLKRIVDNEDISFARKVCKISHEEYLTYKAMVDEGLINNEEYNSESDSDTDSESDAN